MLTAHAGKTWHRPGVSTGFAAPLEHRLPLLLTGFLILSSLYICRRVSKEWKQHGSIFCRLQRQLDRRFYSARARTPLPLRDDSR